MIRVDIQSFKLVFRECGRRGDAVALSQQSETCFQSETFPDRNLFTVRSFFSFSSSFFSSRSRPTSHPVLQMRLDEDRPAFINHPLKRNPWRSIINDLATNSKRSHAQTKLGPLNVSSVLRYAPDWRETEDQILLPLSFIANTLP